MNNNLSLVNKISLLGLLALLTGTGNGVFFALIFTLTLSFSAAVIKIIYLQFEDFFQKKTGEIILWGTGLGISYFLYALLPQIFKSQVEYFNYYFILIGVTPLLYAELKNRSLVNFIINHTLFFDLMLAVSLLRELLGQGSILNYQIFTEPPLSLAANPPGAFLILGLVAFIYEIIINKFKLEKRTANDAELESGVKYE
ncbi:hypothetical protein C8C77_104146 [Halanaerobium saccharolyticum]|uniref:Electron transport complex protein RnfE n=1 Tax=Halanaerobium saccharolyticum TaxID=43595 RepID=A0A4R7Z9Y1_9FIRM|nr:hypothetical protein [Halanaerobium saccharolyticum]RAK10491.1 hypothetical protein C7958_1046 [Halanaerobium saccharolyticum]TDW06752.1 hypothetical protein C8C77_104146 [Halanaerobium saccharolyticum]TDX62387.1 hypothetical protein C7956_104146 [Halanaerobium saccharolyticum]